MTGKWWWKRKRSADDPNLAEYDENFTAKLQRVHAVNMSRRYHNGGTLAFDKDGYLLVSVGDDGGDENGPNFRNQKSAILRLDVSEVGNGQPAPGNLKDIEDDADPFVWDYGFRNPWRLSVDMDNGDVYVGDVGGASIEEISVHEYGDGPQNYQWGPRNVGWEGDMCRGDCDQTGTPPVLTYRHFGNGADDDGRFCSGNIIDGNAENLEDQDREDCTRAVVGGHVYRGIAIPELYGRYIYGDQPKVKIESFILKDGQAECKADLSEDLKSDELRLMFSFGQDANGEVYVLDARTGKIFRIEKE